MKKLLCSSTTILIILFFAACSKKDSNNKPPTKIDFLTTGNWKLTAVMADEDGDGTYETNSFAEFESCYTDNTLTFKTNGKLQLDEGTSKCAASDPQSMETDWQLTNNETTLVIHLDSWLIQELTATTLKWKEVYSNNRSAIVTLTKQ